jgi:hypothetical protein
MARKVIILSEEEELYLPGLRVSILMTYLVIIGSALKPMNGLFSDHHLTAVEQLLPYIRQHKSKYLLNLQMGERTV